MGWDGMVRYLDIKNNKIRRCVFCSEKETWTKMKERNGIEDLMRDER
jgi:hypothetical protein